VADYFGNALAVRIPIAILVYLLLNALLPILSFLPFVTVSAQGIACVRRLALAQILYSMLLLHYGAFRALGNTWFEGLGQALGALGSFGLGWLFIREGRGAAGLATAFLVSYSAVFVLESVLGVSVYALHRFRVTRERIREMVREAVPLGIGTVAYQIYYQSDVVLLYLFWDRATVGVYNAAYHLITLLLQAPAAYFKTVLPHFARAWNESKESFEEHLRRSGRLMAVCSIPLTAAICVAATPIIAKIYSGKYPDSAIVLQVAVWITAFSWIGQTFTNALIAKGASRWYRRYSLYAAGLNVFLNLLIIPKYGAVGAASTTVVTELIVNALFYYRVRREGVFVPLGRILAVPVAIAFLAGIVLAWVF
jgi:O-antigen/teichoic acid export membrane protein